MTNAKKRLEEFKVETTGPFDIATMVVEYLHHTSDDTSTQTRTVFTLLARWREAIETEASPLLVAKTKRIGEELKELLEKAGHLTDDLADASSGINRYDVEKVRRDKSQQS